MSTRYTIISWNKSPNKTFIHIFWRAYIHIYIYIYIYIDIISELYVNWKKDFQVQVLGPKNTSLLPTSCKSSNQSSKTETAAGESSHNVDRCCDPERIDVHNRITVVWTCDVIRIIIIINTINPHITCKI